MQHQMLLKTRLDAINQLATDETDAIDNVKMSAAEMLTSRNS